LTGPSAVGKDTLLAHLLKYVPSAQLAVTATTRAPRTGEEDGVDYHFYSVPEFEAMIERGDLLEYARVYGDWKGVPRKPIALALASGKDVLLRTDVQGARYVKSIAPGSITVFVAPPSIAELERRLVNRGADNAEQAELRLKVAEQELETAGEFDYTVINDDLDRCAQEIADILDAERARPDRQAVDID
jgi:guanylate kinase